VTGFALANPKLAGEREQARTMLERQPANRPAPGTAIVTDKGLSGEDTEAFFTRPDLGLTLIRPARKDEKAPRYFPNWLRQRVEAIIWTLKTSSASNATAAGSPPGCGPASSSGCSRSTPPSGSTGRSAPPSSAPSSPSTTELPTFPGQRSSTATLSAGGARVAEKRGRHALDRYGLDTSAKPRRGNSLGLLEFEAVLGEPGKQVMAAGPDEVASGEAGVIGDLGDRH
jgi:hypothetical protein